MGRKRQADRRRDQAQNPASTKWANSHKHHCQRALARLDETPKFNVRVYYRHRESGVTLVARYNGMQSMAVVAMSFAMKHPDCRVLGAKVHRGRKFVKPEHPIAMRRRLRDLRNRQVS